MDQPWWRVKKWVRDKKLWAKVPVYVGRGHKRQRISEEENPEEFLIYVQRIWDRDHERMQAATDRAELLSPTNGVLALNQGEQGLSLSAELKDLAEYLKDFAGHHSPCYGFDERGMLVVPVLTHPTKWHCSKPTEWAVANKKKNSMQTTRLIKHRLLINSRQVGTW